MFFRRSSSNCCGYENLNDQLGRKGITLKQQLIMIIIITLILIIDYYVLIFSLNEEIKYNTQGIGGTSKN